MVVTTYPGVYIEEFTPGAPIQGVGTSTAAFIGAASAGDLRSPTKLTSWDQFRATFGPQPLPGLYLWYAVRGFFENGGQVCYVVRASNGAYGTLTVNDSSDPNNPPDPTKGKPLFTVSAAQPGNPAQVINVQVTRTNLLPNTTTLYRPSAPFKVTSARTVDITGAQPGAGQNAAQFRPGDWINLGGSDTRLQLVQVSGITLRVDRDISAATNATGTVQLADVPVGTQTVRIVAVAPQNPLPPATLVPGTILTFTQGALHDSQVVDSVQSEALPLATPITTYRVTLRQGLQIPIAMGTAANVQSEEFNLVITQGGAATTYSNLSVDPQHPRYYVNAVNSSGGLVVIRPVEPPPTSQPPRNLPAAVGGSLGGGKDEDLSTLADSDFTDALDTLQHINDANLIAIPDRQTATVQQALVDHCQLLGDRFGVIDSVAGEDIFGATSVETQRRGLDSARGYAALYYPWLRVPPSGAGDPILVPPSGHVCGIIARSDNTRGVHKAPANEVVNGALGVERTMSDIDQGQLNLQGINIIRVFQEGGRPMLWGARTTATDLNWQYVNIRRLFLFLEGSIEEGIRWAVFEPNNLSLWQKLKRSINEFLTRVWRDGALFGETADKAFYVRIDDALNPFSEQALGRLHIEIGVRPAYPAEFIIVRIGIWPGGSDVAEG